MTPELELRVLAAPRFVAGRRDARLSAVLAAMPAVHPQEEVPDPDWQYLVTAASFLVESRLEEAQTAVLEVAQGCLVSDNSTPESKAAAVILLERLGNRPAADLAAERGAVDPVAWMSEPQVALDVVRTRLELSVPTAEGPGVRGESVPTRVLVGGPVEPVAECQRPDRSRQIVHRSTMDSRATLGRRGLSLCVPSADSRPDRGSRS